MWPRDWAGLMVCLYGLCLLYAIGLAIARGIGMVP